MMSPPRVYSNKNRAPSNQKARGARTNANQLGGLSRISRVKSKERRGDLYQRVGYKTPAELVRVKSLPLTELLQDEQRAFYIPHTRTSMVVREDLFTKQEVYDERETPDRVHRKVTRVRSDTMPQKPAKLKREKRNRALSLPQIQPSIDEVNSTDTDFTNHRAKGRLCEELTASEHRIFAIMSNVAHIVFGVAIIQLGIVGTWYKRYMNFQEDQLRHVLYVCILFAISGSYGVFVVVKRLADNRSHKITYKVLTSLSIIASCFIIAIGIKIVIAENYKSSETVIVAFDGLLIGLATIEIPTAFVSIYLMTSHHQALEKEISVTDLMSVADGSQDGDKAPPTWTSIFNVILNVAHIILGLCIIELGMVGMIYRRFMNIDSTGLFSVVFVSVSFVSVGMIGIYNQVTGRNSISCNRSMYTCASIVAVGSATVILTMISVTMASNKYYAGIEAIVAFDSMILSMSGIELGVGIAAMVLVLTPVCLSKLREYKEDSDSVKSCTDSDSVNSSDASTLSH